MFFLICVISRKHTSYSNLSHATPKSNKTYIRNNLQNDVPTVYSSLHPATQSSTFAPMGLNFYEVSCINVLSFCFLTKGEKKEGNTHYQLVRIVFLLSRMLMVFEVKRELHIQEIVKIHPKEEHLSDESAFKSTRHSINFDKNNRMHFIFILSFLKNTCINCMSFFFFIKYSCFSK